ncbi:MAG: hypothetical protein H6807_09970 [Planctomycetes bacterium]|nr:hypothetical protein [Planctomycetota bacterium]
MRHLAALLLITVCTSAQVTLKVPSASYPTIQSAIDAAADGDIVQLESGVFNEALAVNGKSITLRGAGKNATTLDWAARGIAFIVCSDLGSPRHVTIEDLRITMLMPPFYEQLAIFWSGSMGRLTLRNVRIEHWNGQLYLGLGELEIVDSDFIDCAVQDQSGRFGSFFGAFPVLSVVRSTFRNLTIGVDPGASPKDPSGALFAGDIQEGRFEDCLFEGHRGGQLFAGGNTSVKRCVFRDCNHVRATVNPTFLATCALIECTAGSSPDSGTIADCLFVDCETELGPVLDLWGNTTVSRSTFTANRSRAPQFGLIRHLGGANPAHFDSVLISGNDDDRIELSFDVGVRTYYLENCLLESSWFTVPTYFTSGNFSMPVIMETDSMIGLAAGFRDPDGGDFGLLPGSPGVDAGRPGSTLPMLDLAGASRIVGAAPDIGCYEAQVLDPGPAYAGTTTTPDILSFNGTSGGLRRTVAIDAGTTCTLAMADPSPGGTAPFILWGYLGVPRPAEAFSIPFAGGTMAFRPHLVSAGDPLLFTMTNNLLAPASGLLSSTPTPWSVTGAAVPFPITMTLQGLVAEGAGPLRITNAITLHAR